jgi:hypothetical protein
MLDKSIAPAACIDGCHILLDNTPSKGTAVAEAAGTKPSRATVVASVVAVIASLGCEYLFYQHLESATRHISAARIAVAAIGFFALFMGARHVWREARAYVRGYVADIPASGLRREIVQEAVLLVLIAVLAAMSGTFVAFLRHDAADWRYGAIAALFAVALFLLAYHRVRIRDAAHWGFLIVGAAVVSSLLIAMPSYPSVSWDGAIHFDNINGLSYLGEAEYDGSDQVALVDSAQGNVAGYGDDDHPWWSDRNIEMAEQDDAALDAAAETTETIVQTDTLRVKGNGSYIKPQAFGYIPSAIGIWLGNVLGLAGSARLLLARLFSGLSYLTFWFLGIRYLKSGKFLASACALIPTALHIAVNFSYDAWIISLYGFAFCRFIGAMQRPDETLRIRDMLSIVIPYLLGSFAKATFFPVGFGFMFMPKANSLPSATGRSTTPCSSR